jgi:hypothetical protein
LQVTSQIFAVSEVLRAIFSAADWSHFSCGLVVRAIELRRELLKAIGSSFSHCGFLRWQFQQPCFMLWRPPECCHPKLEKTGLCAKRESDPSLSVRLSWTARARVTPHYTIAWRQSWLLQIHANRPLLQKPPL